MNWKSDRITNNVHIAWVYKTVKKRRNETKFNLCDMIAKGNAKALVPRDGEEKLQCYCASWWGLKWALSIINNPFISQLTKTALKERDWQRHWYLSNSCFVLFCFSKWYAVHMITEKALCTSDIWGKVNVGGWEETFSLKQSYVELVYFWDT